MLPYIILHEQLETWALDSDYLDSISLLTSCVTLIKLLNCSVLLFLYLKVKIFCNEDYLR